MKKPLLFLVLFFIPAIYFGQIFKFNFTGAAVCPTPNNTPVNPDPNVISLRYSGRGLIVAQRLLHLIVTHGLQLPLRI